MLLKNKTNTLVPYHAGRWCLSRFCTSREGTNRSQMERVAHPSSKKSSDASVWPQTGTCQVLVCWVNEKATSFSDRCGNSNWKSCCENQNSRVLYIFLLCSAGLYLKKRRARSKAHAKQDMWDFPLTTSKVLTLNSPSWVSKNKKNKKSFALSSLFS